MGMNEHMMNHNICDYITTALSLENIFSDYKYYTTNPIERSAAASKHSRSEMWFRIICTSHRALAEQWPSKSVERSASAQWDSTGKSKSLSLVELSVGLVV